MPYKPYAARICNYNASFLYVFYSQVLISFMRKMNNDGPKITKTAIPKPIRAMPGTGDHPSQLLID